MTHAFDLDWLTRPFDPISLDTLNARAEMMSRIDNKYVLRADQLGALLPALASKFDILDIDERRAFTYATRYFDDEVKSAYFEHHQGLRKGFKVRVRRYVDASLCFLEVKVKGKRGMTEKFRMPYDSNSLDCLTEEAKGFAQRTYRNQYEKSFDYILNPALDLQYQRIALVAREGEERMTIDTNMRFMANGLAVSAGMGVFIVETKSANGRGFADILLRNAHERPTKRCSKYCIGMAATGQVMRYNRFLPTLRKLGMTSPNPRRGQWSEIRPDLRQNLLGFSSVSVKAAA